MSRLVLRWANIKTHYCFCRYKQVCQKVHQQWQQPSSCCLLETKLSDVTCMCFANRLKAHWLGKTRQFQMGWPRFLKHIAIAYLLKNDDTCSGGESCGRHWDQCSEQRCKCSWEASPGQSLWLCLHHLGKRAMTEGKYHPARPGWPVPQQFNSWQLLPSKQQFGRSICSSGAGCHHWNYLTATTEQQSAGLCC